MRKKVDKEKMHLPHLLPTHVELCLNLQGREALGEIMGVLCLNENLYSYKANSGSQILF